MTIDINKKETGRNIIRTAPYQVNTKK